jgi:hypothetical protein
MSGMIHPRNPQAPAFPLLSQNSEKVIKTLSYAADLSKSKNCLSRHGLSTAYGMKALAISFFNAFAYLALGLYHFTKEICHCNWSQASKMLGNDVADSAKSFAFSVVCVGIVALGVLFPKTMYSCFTAKQDEAKVIPEIPQRKNHLPNRFYSDRLN